MNKKLSLIVVLILALGLVLILAGFILGRKGAAQTNKQGLTFPTDAIANLLKNQEYFVLDTNTHNLIFRASYITNLPNYRENFVLTSNGDYVANTDPTWFWRHSVWKEMSNGWRVGLFARTNRPGYVNVFIGSSVTNSGPGYFVPPYGKFAKFELLSPDGKVVQPRPNAGTNMVKWYDYSLRDQTNVPAWASPTNGSLVVDFPETALATDFPHYETGELPGRFVFLARDGYTGMNRCQLGDLYSITNEGDYTLTVQAVLYKDEAAKDGPILMAVKDGHPTLFQTNVVLHRVDLPSVTTKVYLIPIRR